MVHRRLREGRGRMLPETLRSPRVSDTQQRPTSLSGIQWHHEQRHSTEMSLLFVETNKEAALTCCRTCDKESWKISLAISGCDLSVETWKSGWKWIALSQATRTGSWDKAWQASTSSRSSPSFHSWTRWDLNPRQRFRTWAHQRRQDPELLQISRRCMGENVWLQATEKL